MVESNQIEARKANEMTGPKQCGVLQNVWVPGRSNLGVSLGQLFRANVTEFS
jgi:hypothetical protein